MVTSSSGTNDDDAVTVAFRRALEQHKKREVEVREVKQSGALPSQETHTAPTFSGTNSLTSVKTNAATVLEKNDAFPIQDLESALVAERHRMEKEVEQYHRLVTQRLGETERERDRASAQLAQKVEELVWKDKQLQEAYQETARYKEVVETMRLERAELEQEHERAHRRAQERQEGELAKVRHDLAHLETQHRSLMSLLNERNEELRVVHTQLAEWERKLSSCTEEKRVLQEQSEDAWEDARRVRAVVAQRDQMLRELEDDKEQLNRRVQQLEQVLRTMTEENSAHDERAVNLRLERDRCEEDWHRSVRSHASLARRVYDAAVRIYEEVCKVLEEVDRSRCDLHELTRTACADPARSVHTVVAGPSAYRLHTSDGGAAQLSEEECLALTDKIFDCMIRSEEMVSIAWEDVHALRLDYRHELMRDVEQRSQTQLLREAVAAEAAHKEALLSQMEETQSTVWKLEKERSLLRASLEESERWMEDAMQCTREQRERILDLTEQLRVAQQEAQRSAEQLDEQRKGCVKLQNEVNALIVQLEEARVGAWTATQQRTLLQDSLRSQKHASHSLYTEMEAVQQHQSTLQEELKKTRERQARSEGEAKAIRQQYEEQCARLQMCEAQREQLLKENRTLREESNVREGEVRRLQAMVTSVAESERLLKDTLREKEHQVSVLRKQRDDADTVCIRLREDHMSLGASHRTTSGAVEEEAMDPSVRRHGVDAAEARVQQLLARRWNASL